MIKRPLSDRIPQFVDRGRNLLRTDFIKASSYSAIATGIKFITAFAMSKIIAMHLGPQGLGIIGQFTNFVSIVLVLAGGGVSSGVVKYVADYRANSPQLLPDILSTALKLVVIVSICTGIVLFATAPLLSRIILFSNDYALVFKVFGVTILLYVLNTLLLSIVNGYKSFKKYNLINIIINIAGLAVSLAFIWLRQLEGALLAIASSQSVVFFISIALTLREPWLRKENFSKPISRSETSKLVRYMAMAVVSSLCLPLAQLYLRSLVIRDFSMSAAGLWDAVNRISNVYLLFIITTLSTYYLPRLSEIKEEHLLRKEIFKTARVVMPLVLFLSASIFFFRGVIIRILFTADFNEAENLFLAQMCGDVLKVASWLLAVQMLAKSMTRMYIAMEVIFTLSFLVLSIALLYNFGLQGLSIAYAINYGLYLLAMIWVFRHQLIKKAA